MDHAANGSGIGQPVRRREDLRLVRGGGRYTSDENLPGQVHAFMVRSPHAHARIRAIATDAAKAVPGVIAVFTGADCVAGGLKAIPHIPWSPHQAEVMPRLKDGVTPFEAPHHALPTDKARFVGEAVAMVVADTVYAAKNGAEAVEVEYEILPAVVDTVPAARQDAPRVHESNNSNVCFDSDVGDFDATETAFAHAAHVTRFETWVQRVTGVPMEPRAALAEFDKATNRYTVYAGNGGAFRLKNDLAKMLDVPPEQVRVLMQDVGGNFGTRGMIYAEFALTAWAAKLVGRPVKWTIERHEALLSDYQARDLAVEAELALDAKGKFLAMRGSNLGNLGAHTTNFAMVQKGVQMMSSVYRMPAAYFRARATLSHTSPTRPYRSAGRPEVIYVMERLIDLAARECGYDRVALRRKNLVTEKELPYKNPFGAEYDNGDYVGAMDWALRLADWKGFKARAKEAKKHGKRRGIGVGNYVDISTGVPREKAEITVAPDGFVELVIGVTSQGQGHETSFAQLICEWLGVPIDSVRMVTGDTDRVSFGGGAHSGRGMRLGSIVIKKSSDIIIEKAKRIAEHLLEAALADIEFQNGTFVVKGTNHSVGIFEVARAAVERKDLPEDLQGPLYGVCDETVKEASYPYGAHVCEVEVDPDTGKVTLINYVAVDDVGRAINPLIIHGQVHGGIAQGVGQALLEHAYYDPESGQMLAGSLMDYALPRATDMVNYITEISEVPATSHPLGIRPAGEGGTVPALGVTINAVVDALSDFGVRHVEMPATPERVWRAIQDARGLRAG
ncbi:MAG TPA: xanthine dehydrogenase family protein molybdopterin-binding subunit [Xanthobacteraceae bacterium]|jgi:carbon-monoxide dehydrogenase large subunit|nr:xanthine dehydrogenase family protein molybdopterin-binding subunit [Xanthobacteraceae bacterium]